MKLTLTGSPFARGVSIFLSTSIVGLIPATADVFTIDPNQSSLTVSGNVAGGSYAPQGPGSLTDAYSGTIQVAQTGGTLQFTGLSLITAQTNGSWQPLPGGGAGNAPANYGASASLLGGFVGVVAAFRSLQFDVTSPAIPVAGGQFNPSSLTFLLPTNGLSTLDYRESGFATDFGSKQLSGNATNNVASAATLTTVGNVQTLTLGVNAQFTFTVVSANDTIVNVSGQLVATRSIGAPQVRVSTAVAAPVVTLNWQSPAGQFFQVLSSSNLVAWQTNASNITSGSTNYTWTTTNTAPRGFYRVAH